MVDREMARSRQRIFLFYRNLETLKVKGLPKQWVKVLSHIEIRFLLYK